MYLKKIAGLLLFLGASQFLIFMLIAEVLYGNYSISENTISDLGVGPHSAVIFNASIIILGMFIIFAAIIFHPIHKMKLFSFLLVLTGIGAMGVGIFNENLRPLHEIFAAMTFIFGGISEIWSSRLIRFPLSVCVIVLGSLTLIFIILFASEIYLGLGRGGTERMAVYPIILWGAGFGSYLMASDQRWLIQESDPQSL
jgi:hypothetical membrane protein